MKTIIRVKRVASDVELAKAFRIRMRVFVEEQGVPKDIELDGDDQRAIHFLATMGGKAVGTARIVARRNTAKIGRMAVLKSYRRRDVGKRLLQRAITETRKLGAAKIYLHAQVPVIGFYEKLHFHCIGPIFEEAGIPHRTMVYDAKKNR